jgi:hypothetical protein
MKQHLNLIPLQYRRKQMIRSLLRTWATIYGLAMLGFVIAGWWAWNQNSEQRIELTAKNLQYAPIQRLQDETLVLDEETVFLQEQEELLLELSQTHSMLSLLGQLSKASVNCGKLVSINDLSLSTKPKQSSQIKISGIGVNDVAIAQFVAELRDSQMFGNVKLTSSGTTKVGNKSSKAYTLECTF